MRNSKDKNAVADLGINHTEIAHSEFIEALKWAFQPFALQTRMDRLLKLLQDAFGLRLFELPEILLHGSLIVDFNGQGAF